MVARQKYEGKQGLLKPRSRVILTRCVGLLLPEGAQRNRGKQG